MADRGTTGFLRDQRGTIAMLTALSMVALLGMVGLAVDGARAYSAHARIANALDAAVLAATRDLSNGIIAAADVQAIVGTYFQQNISLADLGLQGAPSVAVTVNAVTGTVAATGAVVLPTTFMRVLDFDTIDIGAETSARYSTKLVELSLVLDVTGSMESPHQKMVDLKAAATDLVTTLLPADGRMNARVRISVVPFSNAVNVSEVASSAYGNVGTLCMSDRLNDNFMDVSPLVLAASYATMATTSCPGANVLPLTNNRTTLTTRIDALSGNGTTAGHTGLAWGWYMLSPNWASMLPAASRPVAYSNTGTLKFIVFMTDGDFNAQNFPSQNGSSAQQARRFCANAKAAGVTIYTIAFQAPSGAQSLMRDCATSTSHYFDASSSSELRSAFATIAYNVNSLWLSE